MELTETLSKEIAQLCVRHVWNFLICPGMAYYTFTLFRTGFFGWFQNIIRMWEAESMERPQVKALMQQGQVYTGAHAHEPDSLAFHLENGNTATYQTSGDDCRATVAST